ncbi:YusW family protein [Salipaludibacillus sp. HK11]|uniref:YusW family protein n=1 Tax=Salipaludibacillus sp. HK11 TaxID=3394320 RepID=UPI0039FC2D28
MKRIVIGLTSILLLSACGAGEMNENSSNTGAEINTGAENGNNQNELPEDESNNDGNDEDNADNQISESESQNDSSEETTMQGDVYEFDLHVEFLNGEEWEFEYERDDEEDMEIERDGEEAILGADARLEIEEILTEINITKDRPLMEMKEEVLSVLDVSIEEVEDFDLEMKYDSGEAIEFDHESGGNGDLGNVRELDIDIDFFNGDDWKYEYDADDQEAEIERGDGIEIEGSEALSEIEALLGEISITTDRSIQEMKQEVLLALDIDESDVKDFDIDVEYENGETVKFKHDVE